jgi:DNA primase
MAYYDREWINELIAKVDIEDVISDYVTLQNKSGRLWGLCPFHSEKTPSFSVQKDKQIYYCFGCHESGNAISFVMKIDKLTFPETIERLAQRVSLPLPKNTSDKNYEENKKRREKIYEINKKAGLFYYKNLYEEDGKEALDYLYKRELNDKTIKKFGVGYAKDSWDSLLNFLKAEGYSAPQIKDAGLCSIKNENIYDSFRNRVMFPIFNIFGDVIGFGGRVLDDSMPKYLNTSDTFAFNKRKNVYSLNFVKSIKRIQSVVLVEGYMDVISLYSKGIFNSVATLGTALTKEQALLIKRYVPRVYIAYDGDKAGQNATLKAIDILENTDLSAKVIKFNEGFDPDEFIKSKGYNAFVDKAKNAIDSVNFKIDKLSEEYDLNKQEDKAKYIVEATIILRKLKNPIEQEQYILRLSKETGHSIDAIKDQISSKTINANIDSNNRYNIITKDKKNEKNKKSKLEMILAEYFIANPKKIGLYDFEAYLPYFRDERIKNILNVVNNRIKEGILPTHAEMLTDLNNEEQTIAGGIMARLDDDNSAYIDIKHVLEEFERKAINENLDDLYKELETTNNNDTILAKISELNKELHEKKKKPY